MGSGYVKWFGCCSLPKNGLFSQENTGITNLIGFGFGAWQSRKSYSSVYPSTYCSAGMLIFRHTYTCLMCVLNVSHMDLILNNSPYRLIDRLWSTDMHIKFHENMTHKSWFVSFVPYWSQFTVELAACMKMAHSYTPNISQNAWFNCSRPSKQG